MSLIVSIYDGESGTGRENRLHYWLRFDSWTIAEAMFILCDLDPDLTDYDKKGDGLAKAGDFAGRVVDPWEPAIDDAAKRVQDLRRIWWSGGHDYESQSPADWIAWARRKRIRVPWFDWAERSHLMPGLPAPTDSLTAPGTHAAVGEEASAGKGKVAQLDPDHPNWPEELDIAVTAWRAAVNRKDPAQRPAPFIREWLRTNYPRLSEAARERIATVANWDKTPGASKGNDAAE